MGAKVIFRGHGERNISPSPGLHRECPGERSGLGRRTK